MRIGAHCWASVIEKTLTKWQTFENGSLLTTTSIFSTENE